MAESGKDVVNKIMKRYEDYTNYLRYPGDWGERAFRFWLVMELFHNYLKWPIDKIVFGERFDVLLINDEIKPVINIETKKPGVGSKSYSIFKNRIKDYQTLNYAVLTDGFDWLIYNCIDKIETKFNTKKDENFNEFIKPLSAKMYLYEVEK